MSDNKNVMVLCEGKAGKLAPISAEGLGIGRKLADDLGEALVALVIGSGVGGLPSEAVQQGADKVYVVDAPVFADYQAEAYVAALELVLGEARPQILILGQNDIGRDLAPRLSFRLGTAAVFDCLELAIDPESKRLLQTKPVYGGNAVQVLQTATDPQIVTIRSKAMAALAPDPSRKGEIVAFDAAVDASALRTQLAEKVIEEAEGVRLEDAAVVVSGGRGIGGPEGFEALAALAKAFKGALGASRPACDSNWLPPSHLVGLTGKIIAPDIYVAVAISGSCQHMAGCSGSKNIIAINKDPDANIFNYARFGVIGDWKEIVPALTEKLKTMVD